MMMSIVRVSPLVVLLVASPAFAVPGLTTATFQHGIDGYTSVLDRKISPTGGADANGADIDTDSAGYFLDGGGSALDDSGARHGLIRFDDILGGSGLPAGAKVISATLDFVTNTVADAQSGAAYNLYRLTTPFDGTSTWADPFGGNGIVGDIDYILGSFDRAAQGQPISARADKAVQSWINGDPNHGFGIRSDRSTDGWSMHTTGASTVAVRPKLTVNYSLSPFVEVASYQQGVNGYTGTTDLRIASAGGDVDGSTVQEIFLDGFDADAASPDQSYLIRFGGIDLSNYRQIHRAELVLVSGFASPNADSPGPFTVHQVRQDWSTSTTYASLDSNGDPTLNDVTELEAAGRIGPAAATVTGMNDTEVIHIDVTSIVENWRAGDTNHGFFIGTPPAAQGGTANGWQIFVSGAADPNFRPELRIVGVLVPEPATATLLAFAALLATALGARRR